MLNKFQNTFFLESNFDDIQNYCEYQKYQKFLKISKCRHILIQFITLRKRVMSHDSCDPFWVTCWEGQSNFWSNTKFSKKSFWSILDKKTVLNTWDRRDLFEHFGSGSKWSCFLARDEICVSKFSTWSHDLVPQYFP